MRLLLQRPSLLLLTLALAVSACAQESPIDPPPAPTAPKTEAPAPPPGKVAGGTIRGLQSGDVACYVTLGTDKGEQVSEMAGFEICEKQDLVGKKVSLTWEEANVMAAECQGDVDCGKSEKVWLIASVKTQ